MIDQIRTLPIRLAPIEGEALDSWLDTLCHRLSTTWGDLIEAIGLSALDGTRDNSWLLRLTGDQADKMAAATAVPATQLHAMTLSYYDGSGLRLLPDAAMIDRAFPWGRSRFSRYCPYCLRESGGRWQLFWRLGWAFACETHRCLLLDECPDCGQRQREKTTPAEQVPLPGHCMRPGSNATGRSPARCNAGLSSAVATVFPQGHPVLVAQHTIRRIIETGTVTWAIYVERPTSTSSTEILSDVRALATRILGHARNEDLHRVLPTDLYDAYLHVPSVNRTFGEAPSPAAKLGLKAPAHAATAAAGVTAALDILTASDIELAADRLRWLISSGRDNGQAVNATTVTTWGRGTTATLTGIQLAALGPLLKPSDQLRYRVGSTLPTPPSRNRREVTAVAGHLPAALWPPWALRLYPPRMDYQNLATALSCALLLVSSRLSLDTAAAAMNRSADGHALSHVLQRLERDQRWNGIRVAICRLADYLHSHDVPINYQRRRRLDYSTLLSTPTWSQICGDAGTAKGGNQKIDVARCHLYATLTGNPVELAPWFTDTNQFISALTRFPAQLTPELAEALDTEAQKLLTSQNISEPVTWHPPLSILDGLHLPGSDPQTLDIAKLHTLTRNTTALGAIAEQLDTNIETVRYALTCHPAPQEPLTFDQKRARGLHARDLQEALSHDQLKELYVGRELTFREIAALYGVERKAVARLAKRYGIRTRPANRPRLHETIDYDWLHTQYVLNGRALPELAAEKNWRVPCE